MRTVITVLALSMAGADEPPFSMEECRRVLSVFDEIGLPDPKGRELVLYNAGAWELSGDQFAFVPELGWVLSESPERVELAQKNLMTRTHSRKGFRLPDDWARRKPKVASDLLPGQKQVVDLRAFCREVLRKEIRRDSDHDHLARGDLPFPLEPALHAWWALRSGEEELAKELFLRSRSAAAHHWEYRDEGLKEALQSAIAVNLRWQAINAANQGEPAGRLLDLWRKTVTIASSPHRGEAEEMVRLYEARIEEDRAFRDPSPAELARFSPDERARVWIHRLRDLAARQWSQPGSCSVLGDWTGLPPGTVNPADELVNLGWKALPRVMQHLGDVRPTRCMGYYRDFDLPSFELLRVADCLLQVFVAISGFDIYEKSRDRRGRIDFQDRERIRRIVLEWWKEEGPKGPERWFLKLLEDEEHAGRGARHLLEIDAGKHLPALLEVLRKGPASRRRAVLAALAGHLRQEHRPLVESLLRHEDLETVKEAARTLWLSFRSVEGARAVLDLLGGNPGAGAMNESFRLLDEVRPDFAADGLAKILAAPDSEERREAVDWASRFPSARVAEALLAILEDRTATGSSRRTPIRVCDGAAEALVRLLDLPMEIPSGESVEDCDRAIQTLKTWWRENQSRIDWPLLDRKARGEVIRDWIGLRYILVPGSHPGTLPRPFFLSMGVVTVGQLWLFREETGPISPDPPPSRPDDPAVDVSEEDARAFCRWLGEREGAVCRLPIKAELEHAFRVEPLLQPRGPGFRVLREKR